MAHYLANSEPQGTLHDPHSLDRILVIPLLLHVYFQFLQDCDGCRVSYNPMLSSTEWTPRVPGALGSLSTWIR